MCTESRRGSSNSFICQCFPQYPLNSTSHTNQAGSVLGMCISPWHFARENPPSTSFLLATATFTPLYGRLCNVMGRKRAQQTAVLFMGIGTLLCGLSSSMEMLIAARFVSSMKDYSISSYPGHTFRSVVLEAEERTPPHSKPTSSFARSVKLWPDITTGS